MFAGYLYAPWRMKWVRGKKPKGCVFCRIAKKDKSVPRKVLYEDGKVIVLMNLYPYNVGHLQIVPVRHVEWPEELGREEYERLFEMQERAIRLLRKALGVDGINSGLNLGKFSGQSVKHLHLQIIPRFENEFGFVEAASDTKLMPETLEQTFKRLMRHKKILED